MGTTFTTKALGVKEDLRLPAALGTSRWVLAFWVLQLLGVLSGCGFQSASGKAAEGGLAGPLLASHEYDPVSDAVVSWELDPGESVVIMTFSFRAM